MPADDGFIVITTRNPHYGPQGRPYVVRASGPAGEVERGYWTEAEAWAARDELLDAGYLQVRVLGAPTRGATPG